MAFTVVGMMVLLYLAHSQTLVHTTSLQLSGCDLLVNVEILFSELFGAMHRHTALLPSHRLGLEDSGHLFLEAISLITLECGQAGSGQACCVHGISMLGLGNTSDCQP